MIFTIMSLSCFQIMSSTSEPLILFLYEIGFEDAIFFFESCLIQTVKCELMVINVNGHVATTE